MMSARNKSSSFTRTQWQELDQQVLIYKYMVSGVPIPPDLISTVKRSLESSMSSRFFRHQPVGWGCFQMGFGRKADPEPGRCRRTDGKKWRCSKEAHPDSKYCERHMHRGRNRSRKPVELTASSSSTTTTASYSSHHSISPLSTTNPSSPLLSADHQSYPFLYPHSSSSRSPPASFLSPLNTTTHHLFLDSASYSHTDKDYSYVHGVRDEEEERALFKPLTMSSKFQRLISTGNSREQQQEKHCFIMGTDFKSASAMPIKAEREEEKHKPFHQFLGEWPPKGREYSWLEVEENQSNRANFYPTELSISMPPSTQELFGSESTFHTDG